MKVYMIRLTRRDGPFLTHDHLDVSMSGQDAPDAEANALLKHERGAYVWREDSQRIRDAAAGWVWPPPGPTCAEVNPAWPVLPAVQLGDRWVATWPPVEAPAS